MPWLFGRLLPLPDHVLRVKTPRYDGKRRRSAAPFLFGFSPHLDNPERSEPAEDMCRLVLTAMHGRVLGSGGQWATTLIFGRNEGGGHGGSHSVWLETEAMPASSQPSGAHVHD